MPAEWERHEATWLAYPFDSQSPAGAHRHWPRGVFRSRQIEKQWAHMTRHLTTAEVVNILVANGEVRDRLRRVFDEVSSGLADHPHVRLHTVPSNWSWIRDTGGIFLVNNETGERMITHWAFNGWGKEPWRSECSLDRKVPLAMSRIASVERRRIGCVLEGGSIDVNGTGSLLTTEECLLHENRLLPGQRKRTRDRMEELLCGNLGVRNVLWLHRGIGGDDTSGHVDDLTRFVSRDTVLTMVAPRLHGQDHVVLRENLKRLERMRDERGRQLTIMEVPLPKPDSLWGQMLPMSYANFYIGNNVVLAPVFGDPNDAKALGALQAAFPDRMIVDLYAKDLVWGLGTYHCSTQQEPAAPQV
ncbi:MAG: agmatine deiminase [Candidatus Peregrinibacteria bacterium Greene0416_19]|nr:MAG: agmatine deiminase [Candidatus Peregrinibacteria bacterium Greene0416_19]